jgi:hypothetical protein
MPLARDWNQGSMFPSDITAYFPPTPGTRELLSVLVVATGAIESWPVREVALALQGAPPYEKRPILLRDHQYPLEVGAALRTALGL